MQAATSSSEDEDTDDEETAPVGSGAKRRRLKVPDSVVGLFSNAGPRSNPDLHQGRTRRVAHVEGNYATLVYLPVDATDLWKRRSEQAATVLRKLAGLPLGDTEKVHTMESAAGDPSGKGSVGLHVTLGPLVMLRQQFIGPFLDQMKKAVVGVDVSNVFFDDHLEVFGAQDGSRFFAGAVVTEASASWLRILASNISKAVEAFSLAPAAGSVDDMRFHCSLAWTTCDVMDGLAAVGAERRESTWGVSWRIHGAGAQDVGVSVGGTSLRTPGSTLRVKIGERITVFRMSRDDETDDD